MDAPNLNQAMATTKLTRSGDRGLLHITNENLVFLLSTNFRKFVFASFVFFDMMLLLISISGD